MADNDTCAVTAEIRDLGYEPDDGAIIELTRRDRGVVRQNNALIVPAEQRVEIDGSGTATVDLVPGTYRMRVWSPSHGWSGRTTVTVPDAPEAFLAQLTELPPPPDLTSAEQAVLDAQSARDAANTAASEASSSATDAATSRSAAESSETAAATSAANAASSEAAAASSQTAAASSEGAASTSASLADAARADAQTAASDAGAHRTGAETAQIAAETAQTGAETARTKAETAEANAQASAQAAATDADDAASAANLSKGARDEAVAARNAAQTASTNASVSETNAANSADAADGNATAAAGSAAAANSYRSTAQTARDESVAARDESQTARDQSQAAQGAAEAARDTAQAWAESDTAPGGAGTQSAKSWAGEAAASAATLPDPTGAPLGQSIEADGAGGYQASEMPIRGLEALTFRGSDLFLWDTFQRPDQTGGLGTMDSGHQWVDLYDQISQSDSFGLAGRNSYAQISRKNARTGRGINAGGSLAKFSDPNLALTQWPEAQFMRGTSKFGGGHSTPMFLVRFVDIDNYLAVHPGTANNARDFRILKRSGGVNTILSTLVDNKGYGAARVSQFTFLPYLAGDTLHIWVGLDFWSEPVTGLQYVRILRGDDPAWFDAIVATDEAAVFLREGGSMTSIAAGRVSGVTA